MVLAVPFPCCKGGSGFTCLSSFAGPVSFSAIVADGSILPGASGILFCGGQIIPAIFPPCEQWRDSASHVLCWCRNGISWQDLKGVASHYAWCSFCASPAWSVLTRKREGTRTSLVLLEPPSNGSQIKVFYGGWAQGQPCWQLAFYSEESQPFVAGAKTIWGWRGAFQTPQFKTEVMQGIVLSRSW